MRIFAAICLAVLALAAHADAVLSVAAPKVQANGPIELELTLLNSGEEPEVIVVPADLHLRVETSTSLVTIASTPSQTGELTIEPHGFVRIPLRAQLPDGIAGIVSLTATGFETNALMLEIANSAPTDEATLTDEPKRKFSWNAQYTLVDKPPPLAISVYEPVYFIVGGGGGLNAKFQLSFRYRLFDNQGRLARRLPWIDDLYLAFSQTSLWDLSELSKPFTDSSYRPRLFYANYNVARLFDGRLRLGLEGGFGHESNGKDGDASRSYNMLYVRPVALFGDPDGLRAFVAPLIPNYIANDENPDIEAYRGYVDWLFGIGSKGGLDFSATIRRGTQQHYGSVELNLSYPLSKLSGGDLTGWLLLQYFGGYGESLLDYNRKLDSQLRLGIAVAL
jgi:outer membrane phospholipase A